jgi:hypothetical protein
MKFALLLLLIFIALIYAQRPRSTAVTGACGGTSRCIDSTTVNASLPICGRYLSPIICVNFTDIGNLTIFDTNVGTQWGLLANNTMLGYDPMFIPCNRTAMSFLCSVAFPACDGYVSPKSLTPCWSTCADYYNNCNAGDLLDWRCDAYAWGTAGKDNCTGIKLPPLN